MTAKADFPALASKAEGLGSKAATALLAATLAGAHAVAMPPLSPHHDRRDAGFSLVELIVALAIAAMAATAVVMALPGGVAVPAQEAQRLALRLAAARDAAVIGGRPVAVTLDAAGYAFASNHDGAWRPLADRRLARHAWPAGLVVRLRGAAPGAAARRVLFDGVGLASAPLQVDLAAADGGAAHVTLARDGTVALGPP